MGNEVDVEKILKKRKRSRQLILFCTLVVAGVFLASSTLFFVCMLPTFVAWLVDRHPQKMTAVTVGAMNLAATVPAFLELWERGHGFDIAMEMIADPRIILVAYLGAGVGWMIHFNITPVVARMVARKNEKRIKEIIHRQDELVKKWGDKVKG